MLGGDHHKPPLHQISLSQKVQIIEEFVFSNELRVVHSLYPEKEHIPGIIWITKNPKSVISLVSQTLTLDHLVRDSPTLKLCYLSFLLLTLQWKTLLKEKIVIEEIGESQPCASYLVVILVFSTFFVVTSSLICFANISIFIVLY